MAGLAFALSYAWRNLQRGGSRSLFAAFCVAMGVAAVVGMQLLALNISAAVDRAPKQANGGDISVEPLSPLQAGDIARVEDLRRSGVIEDYTLTLNANVKAQYGDHISLFTSLRGIEPAKYPLYGQFLASQPAGPVARLLRNPTDAVVTQDLFDRLQLRIGAVLTLSVPVSERVTIRGVVPTGGLFEGDFSISGSVYQPLSGVVAAYAQGGSSTRRVEASRLFIRTRDDAHTPPALQALQKALPLARYSTAADVAKQAAADSSQLQQLLLACGLLALLIGGIGIVNTMLVSVGRRTKEIAVLKTLGLKGYQVVPLFLMEAVLLGLAGSALGVLGGIGLSALVTDLANWLGAQVSWTLRPGPLAVGLALGVIATAVFGFLPVLRAGATRPFGVLRDEDAPLPRIGWALTGMVTFALTGALGVTAGVVLHDVVLGLALAYGVVTLFLVFSLVFLLVVVAASHSPSFGLVTLRIALRNLTRQKRRVASTLVALCIGMLAVGTVVVLAQNVKDQLHRAFARDWGFNAAVFSSALPGQEQQALTAVRKLPGLRTLEQGLLASGLRVEEIDGRPADQVVNRHLTGEDSPLGALRSVNGRDLRLAHLDLKILAGGRNLAPADEGTGNVLVPQRLAEPLGLHPGSTLRYSGFFGGGFSLRVVGIIDRSSFTPFGNGLIGSSGFLRAHTSAFSSFSILYLQFDSDAAASAAASRLNRDLPQVYAFDLASLLPLFDQILDKATVFPLVLAVLSLFAGGVIIANTVALAVLERRREIGVMKALGARGSTILRLLLLESGLVGLMGGAMGVALAMIATLVIDDQTLHIASHFDPLIIAGLLLVAVGVALVASVISALPASREKPLIVLRYE